MNSKITEIRTYFDNLSEKIDNLKNTYKTEGKNLVNYYSHGINLNHNSFFKVYHSIILRETAQYTQYNEIVKFQKKIEEYRFKIEKDYYEYIKHFDILKNYIQEQKLSKINKNTSRQKLIYLNKLNIKILKMITINLDSEYNNYYETKELIYSYLKKIKMVISIVLHMIYQENNYLRSVDYSKLKKITLNDLKKSDIILYDEAQIYKSSFAAKQISYFVKSTILHSALYIGKEKDNYLLFQTSGRNRRKSFVGTFELEKGIKHIILRHRKKFTEEDEKMVDREVLKMINKKFSILKLYGIGIIYILTKIYKSWFPFLTVGENIYFGKGIFCSESIAIIYEDLDYNISNNPDFGMVSPTDFLNSFELEIIGYIE